MSAWYRDKWTLVIIGIGLAMAMLFGVATWADIESCEQAGGKRKCHTITGIATGMGSGGQLVTGTTLSTSCICYLPDGGIQ